MAELHVWMNGQPVAVWTASRSGMPILRYEPSWIASDAGRPLSLSLPFTADLEHRGPVVTHYFDNLLPDNPDIRRRLRRRYQARSDEAFDLLTAIGRDCVGAVQLLPPGAEPTGWNRLQSDALTDAQVEHLLQSVTSDQPLAADDDAADFRISIAGAQEKTALLRIGDRWHRPHGATPTTHILKLPLGLVGNMRADLGDSVENEWACGRFLATLGFPMAEAAIGRFGAAKALVVTRFDRRWQGVPRDADRRPRFRPPADAWIARLPQEDFCQALGVSPDLKYQSDGGPSMLDGLRVLGAGDNADEDRATFALAQLAFWLLAATDGHAKNFSIQHRRGGRFGLAPLYDVLSAWPIIGDGPNRVAYARARLAMGLKAGNMHYRLRDVHARHWRQLADRCGPGVWPRMLALAAVSPEVLDRVAADLPPDFPARTWGAIDAGVRRHAAAFLAEAAAS